MNICNDINKLPQELKTVIFGFLPFDIRLELIEENKHNKNGYRFLTRAYKWKRGLNNMYRDQTRLVRDIRIKKVIPKFKNTFYHDGKIIHEVKHPLNNLISCDFSYNRHPTTNNVITYMYGFERNWSNGNGELIITRNDWDKLPPNSNIKRRFYNYKSYCQKVKYNINANCSSPIELIIKYLKVRSYDDQWDYKIHKYFFNEYMCLSTSSIMKKYVNKYTEHLRQLEIDRLIAMENYNKRRELKLMEKEDRYMKKIIREEKKINRQRVLFKKREQTREKRELKLMEKEEKHMKKILKFNNKKKK